MIAPTYFYCLYNNFEVHSSIVKIIYFFENFGCIKIPYIIDNRLIDRLLASIPLILFSSARKSRK